MTRGTRNDSRTQRVATILSVLALFLSVVLSGTAQAQSYVETFGQNRVQNRKFEWKYFDTKHFRVYHYDKAGRSLGRYVAEEAENDIAIIEKKLGGQFPKRFNIILYNTYEEYRQTNVGLKDESQATANTKAGKLNLVGDKLVVYFSGEHRDLRHQIRSGMARVVMERLVFGENFMKMVKNALLLDLPEWVTEGYMAYLVDGWDAKTNSDWKSLLDARPEDGFYELSEDYPELAGKAFWKFVSTQYGNNTVKSLLYAMQQKTSLNKAMMDKSNLGLKVTKAYDSCITFYKEIYKNDAKRQEQPDSTKGLISLKVPKDNSVIRNIRVSPMGSDISYVAWKDGRYKVCSQKTSHEQEVSVLLEGGQKDLTEPIDPDYPMMAWSTNGQKLAILYKKGSDVNLKIYNSVKGRINEYTIPKNRFDRVLGITFTQDDDKMVFSVIKKSQSDLYMFTFKGSKMTNITDDPWADVAPVFVSGGSRTGILFLSNRPKPDMNVPMSVNELPNGPMNVFFYNTKTGRSELLQCSDVKSGNVTQPIQYGLENFAYLYDGNGINNKYVVLFTRDRNNKDSAYSVPITNYSTSIISQQYNLASGEVADVVQDKDKYKVYFHELQMPGENVKVKTLLPTTLSIERPDAKIVDGVPTERKNDTVENKIDEPPVLPEIKSGNAFQSEFTDTAEAPKKQVKRKQNVVHNAAGENAAADSSVLNEITDSAYVKMKPARYRPSFKPDFFQIKADNSMLFSQYQSIASNGGKYQIPSLGGLATLSLNELMEDYRITGGIQFPVSLPATSSTYFLQYQNFKHLVDWGVLFLRTSNKDEMTVTYVDNANNMFQRTQLFKSTVNMVQADFSRPLDRIRSIRFHTSLRQDRMVEKATDTFSLAYEVPSSSTYTSVSRLEYVFDNTIGRAININNGTRFKVYSEYLYGLGKGHPSCYNIGLDARNYQKIYKNFIVANRLAYGHSDGSSEVEYLMGGVDNWISPPDASPRKGPNPRYGFQAMENTLRGYGQYARVGNNFFVFSTEFRLPVVATFAKRPIKSPILKNLQVVPFADAGYAWNGFVPENGGNQPFTYPNPMNPAKFNNVLLTIKDNEGLALGYGLGLRSSVFGYFVRMDVAWNIDFKPKPMVYFGLGTDF